jgi:dihydrofolate reductase
VGLKQFEQYLRARLIDEMLFAIAPIILGAGERLFDGIDLRALGYSCVKFVASEKATHIVLQRQ